jgi:hypothetical protein
MGGVVRTVKMFVGHDDGSCQLCLIFCMMPGKTHNFKQDLVFSLRLVHCDLIFIHILTEMSRIFVSVIEIGQSIVVQELKATLH